MLMLHHIKSNDLISILNKGSTMEIIKTIS